MVLGRKSDVVVRCYNEFDRLGIIIHTQHGRNNFVIRFGYAKISDGVEAEADFVRCNAAVARVDISGGTEVPTAPLPR